MSKPRHWQVKLQEYGLDTLHAFRQTKCPTQAASVDRMRDCLSACPVEIPLATIRLNFRKPLQGIPYEKAQSALSKPLLSRCSGFKPFCRYDEPIGIG
jgi:hypothetical protein